MRVREGQKKVLEDYASSFESWFYSIDSLEAIQNLYFRLRYLELDDVALIAEVAFDPKSDVASIKESLIDVIRPFVADVMKDEEGRQGNGAD